MVGKSFVNFILAIGLVLVGTVLLLSNLGVISLEMNFSWENIYPILIAGIGIKLWMNALLKQGGTWVWGSFLTIFGSLLLLDRFELMVFEFGDLLRLWPLLFVYIGFSIFVRGNKRKHRFHFHFDRDVDSISRKPQDTSNQPKSNRMAIGSQKFKKDNWKVEPMDLWNGIGDYHFDFTKAFIPDRDTPIIVRGWIGDVKMLIPKNVPFRVEAKLKTGDIKVGGENASGLQREINYETDDYDTATRRLSLYIEYSVGSIKVDQV